MKVLYNIIYYIMKCLMKYKDIFGKPFQGPHKYRFLGTAIVDYLCSILVAILLTYFTHIPLVLTTIIILLIGIFLHVIFGIPTNTTKYLGL